MLLLGEGGQVPPRLQDADGPPSGARMPQARLDPHERRPATQGSNPRYRSSRRRQELRFVAGDRQDPYPRCVTLGSGPQLEVQAMLKRRLDESKSVAKICADRGAVPDL